MNVCSLLSINRHFYCLISHDTQNTLAFNGDFLQDELAKKRQHADAVFPVCSLLSFSWTFIIQHFIVKLSQRAVNTHTHTLREATAGYETAVELRSSERSRAYINHKSSYLDRSQPGNIQVLLLAGSLTQRGRKEGSVTSVDIGHSTLLVLLC